MRPILQAWWCPQGHKNTPASRDCGFCHHPRIERHAQVHASERAVIYRHPLTGEHRTPPRADLPMPAVYERQGFVREEILNMIAYEKSTGVVHEASNFSAGNESSPGGPERKQLPPALANALVNDLREAAASGLWTESDRNAVFTVPAL